MKRHSRLTAAAIAAALIAPVSGCSAMFTPQATEIHYAGGDGAEANVANVEVAGLMVVTKGKGKPGQLLATVFNESHSPKTVNISVSSFNTTVHVKPQDKVRIGPKNGKNVVIPNVDTKPGELLKVDVTVGSKSKSVDSQVFNGTLPQYRKYLPSPKPSPSKTKSGSQG